MYYQGEKNVPGAPGNLLAGGIPLRQIFPNASSDIPSYTGEGGVIRSGTKQKLKDIFPSFPGGYGDENGGMRYGTTPGGVTSNPFGVTDPLRQAQLYPAGQAIGNMAGMQYSQMPNSSFYLGPQLGQQPGLQVPAGYQAKYVS